MTFRQRACSGCWVCIRALTSTRRRAASLTALDPDDARVALDRLAAAHLLTESNPGRYAFHDLLRAYAAEQARAHENEPERTEALRRERAFYLHAAHAADHLLAPHRPSIQLELPALGTRLRALPDASAAMAWFDAEHSNLLAALRNAAANDQHAAVWQLAWTLTTFQYRRGHRQQELEAWQAAVEAAAHLSDPTARALAHRNLGAAYADLGHHEKAIGHMHEALALSELHHDAADQAHTHYKLAWTWAQQADDRKALYHANRALELFRPLDQPEWEARALNTVGWYAARLGDHDTARTHCQAALTLYQRHDNPNGQAATLDSLGYIDHHTGHHRQAVDHYQQALALRRGQGNSSESANSLDHLGHPLAALGDHEQARAVWSEALDLYQQQGRSEDADRIGRLIDTLDKT